MQNPLESLYWMSEDEIRNHLCKSIPQDRQAFDLPKQYEKVLESLVMIFDNPSRYGIKDVNAVYVDWCNEDQGLAVYVKEKGRG